MGNQLSTCVFVSRREIDATLAVPATPGKRLLEPLKSIGATTGLPMNALGDKEVGNEVEVHRREGGLWGCLEGEVTFVYGGELVEPWAKKLADGGTDDREVKAKGIQGGTEVALAAVDWLWLPAGQPHLHRTNKTARLFIIKIPAKDMVPLDAVPGWRG